MSKQCFGYPVSFYCFAVKSERSKTTPTLLHLKATQKDTQGLVPVSLGKQ